MKKNFYQGSVDGWMIATIGFVVLFLVAGALGAWAYISYDDLRADVDAKIQQEVTEGKREQSDADYKKYQEESKNPRIEFVGPAEYGRVSFMYPRTWSVYIEQDATDRKNYVAYLHPVAVPSISNKDSRFALRLEILNKDYDEVVKEYADRLKKGELTSSTPEYNGIATTRFDGAFSKEVRGAAVLMRVRDKTVRFSTDADTFKPDFQTILETVKLAE